MLHSSRSKLLTSPLLLSPGLPSSVYVCTHVTSGMTGCLGKSGSKGEFVRRIMREQEVVIKDTPGAGRTFFWPYPCRLVLELSHTGRDSPIPLTHWGQLCPRPAASFTTGHLSPGHSGIGLSLRSWAALSESRHLSESRQVSCGNAS